MRVHTVIAAIAILTIGTVSVNRFAAAATTVRGDPEGKVLYDANCRKCHGVIGTPPKAMKAKFPKIATFDAAFFEHRSRDSVVTILAKGKGEDMKSFKAKLTHEQMEGVADYIRTLAKK